MKEQHGHCPAGKPSPTYSSWKSMKLRCVYPASKNVPKIAKTYGGVKVCDRWVNSFINFLADMGERPPGTTLDRIDSKGHYEPGNCRWATIAEQRANQSNPQHLITARGKTQTLAAWARELGVREQFIGNRIANGWSVEEALFCAKSNKWHRAEMSQTGLPPTARRTTA